MVWKSATLVYINGRKFVDQFIYCAPLERESVRLRWLVRFRRNLELDTELNIVSGLDLFARGFWLDFRPGHRLFRLKSLIFSITADTSRDTPPNNVSKYLFHIVVNLIFAKRFDIYFVLQKFKYCGI
jgi:hypothetical protein